MITASSSGSAPEPPPGLAPIGASLVNAEPFVPTTAAATAAALAAKPFVPGPPAKAAAQAVSSKLLNAPVFVPGKCCPPHDAPPCSCRHSMPVHSPQKVGSGQATTGYFPATCLMHVELCVQAPPRQGAPISWWMPSHSCQAPLPYSLLSRSGHPLLSRKVSCWLAGFGATM
jgi:hypothetical protein